MKGTQLKNGLVNLPLSLHAALASKDVPPQSLVVGLTTSRSKRRVYVGWSGMPCQLGPPANALSSKQPVDIIEMDRSFAGELGLEDNDVVGIDLLLKAPTATAVHVTPKTPDDWEVLELHAETVEVTLLSQIRAVVEGQTLCIWVGEKAANKLMLKFVVDQVQLAGKTESGGAPSPHPTEHKPARLDRDTEIIIAPKLRHKPKPASEAVGSYDPPSEQSRAQQLFQTTLFRLLPFEVLQTVHEHLQCNPRLAGEQEQDRQCLVHPALLPKLNTAFPSGSLTLALHPRVSNSSSKSISSKSQNRDKALPQPETVQLRHTAGRVSWKACWKVRPGHVWLSRTLRQELGLHVWTEVGSGYEQMQLLPNQQEQDRPQPDGDVLSPRPKRKLQSLRDMEGHAALSSPSAAARPTLVGANQHVEACKNAVKRCLLAWQPGRRGKLDIDYKSSACKTPLTYKSSCTEASGLLLTGASGSGKSVIVHQVAHEVALDPDVLACKP